MFEQRRTISSNAEQCRAEPFLEFLRDSFLMSSTYFTINDQRFENVSYEVVVSIAIELSWAVMQFDIGESLAALTKYSGADESIGPRNEINVFGPSTTQFNAVKVWVARAARILHDVSDCAVT